MEDPRKHKRMPVNLTCRLRCADDPNPIPATVLDVSFGGMAVVTPQDLPLGAIVEFQHSDFPCASTSNTASKCRVISVRSAKGRASGSRIGLLFETTDMDFIRNLLQWVQLQSLAQKRSQQRVGSPRPRWA